MFSTMWQREDLDFACTTWTEKRLRVCKREKGRKEEGFQRSRTRGEWRANCSCTACAGYMWWPVFLTGIKWTQTSSRPSPCSWQAAWVHSRLTAIQPACTAVEGRGEEGRGGGGTGTIWCIVVNSITLMVYSYIINQTKIVLVWLMMHSYS